MSVTCKYVLLEVVCCCFPRKNILLNMMLFIGSQSFISPPSFMFVSLSAVSEIRELNQNKKKKETEKNSEIGYFQFSTFSGHIYIFNKTYLLRTYIYIFRSPVHHKLKVIILSTL